MDPQATWRELISAFIAHDWETLHERANALLCWLENDGFPPETVLDHRMGCDWNRAIARATCDYAGQLARMVLDTENGIPTGIPFSLSCRECDAFGPDSYEEAIAECWREIEFAPNSVAENFFGDCPEHANPEQSQEIPDVRESQRHHGDAHTTNKENETMANDKKRPVHEVRIGRIRAAIWENSTEKGVRHNVTISRLYKDGDHWKDTASFGRDDLLLIGKVTDAAHSWIYEQGNGSHEVETSGDEPF